MVLDLTLPRLRQVQSVILERRYDEWQRRLRLEETKLQSLVGAVHAAAGNKRGAKAAGKIRLTRHDENDLPSTDQVKQLFGGGRG